MAKQPPKTQQPDAVQMLKADHKQVKKMFDQYRAASEDEKAHIAGRLFTELTIHSMLEEELFYPAVRSKLKASDAIEPEARENGFDLAETAEEDEEELGGVAIDGLELEHIVGEEDVILPIALAELDVQALGIQMQRRRDDLSSSLAA